MTRTIFQSGFSPFFLHKARIETDSGGLWRSNCSETASMLLHLPFLLLLWQSFWLAKWWSDICYKTLGLWREPVFPLGSFLQFLGPVFPQNARQFIIVPGLWEGRMRLGLLGQRIQRGHDQRQSIMRGVADGMRGEEMAKRTMSRIQEHALPMSAGIEKLGKYLIGRHGICFWLPNLGEIQ